MELHLSRKIAEKTRLPGYRLQPSGTRKEELLTTQEERRKCGPAQNHPSNG